MSLDVYINFKQPRQCNFFLEHPYSYSYLSERDKSDFNEQNYWDANITHNLCEMADHIPVKFKDKDTNLYYACWHPDEIGATTVADVLPMLIQGLHYMIDHRKELKQFDSPNGWGTYEGFMKFLLNYKQACEDNDLDCTIETDT